MPWPSQQYKSFHINTEAHKAWKGECSEVLKAGAMNKSSVLVGLTSCILGSVQIQVLPKSPQLSNYLPGTKTLLNLQWSLVYISAFWVQRSKLTKPPEIIKSRSIKGF